METNETKVAVDQTVAQLQGGVLRLGIGSAIPAIAGWERTLANTGAPELQPVVGNLRALREGLASESLDYAEVGRLLTALAEQTRVVATTPRGLPIAAPLTQLSLLLGAGAANLLEQGRN